MQTLMLQNKRSEELQNKADELSDKNKIVENENKSWVVSWIN
jgi:hypothetical protein